MNSRQRRDIVDFREELKKQLGYLQRSAADYDNGHLDEAYRIATAIRILFHKTIQSISLLHHLRAESIPLLSTTEPASPKAVFYDGMDLIEVTNSEISIQAPLDRGQTRRFVSVRDWWTEEIFVDRKSVV